MREQRINCNSIIPTNQCLNCWGRMESGANECPTCGIKYIDFFDKSLISERHVVLRLRDPITQRGVDVLTTPLNASAYVREVEPIDNIDLYPDDGRPRLDDRRLVRSKHFELGFSVDAYDDDFIMRYVNDGDKSE